MGNEKIGPECFPGSDYQDLNTPEPDPRPSSDPAAWDLVIADMRERDRLGTAKYGQRLTPGDGRNSLVDAYQEVLDAAVYLRKAIHEVEMAKREGYMLAVQAFRDTARKDDDVYTPETRHAVKWAADIVEAQAPGEAAGAAYSGRYCSVCGKESLGDTFCSLECHRTRCREAE